MNGMRCASGEAGLDAPQSLQRLTSESLQERPESRQLRWQPAYLLQRRLLAALEGQRVE